ncbi:hypothetical protein ACFVZW_26145 [Streptomyces sp. NPDC059567]|uniref:hypothetical protein n=1 Tax=Streptomyces sp. NPDC059567 TaxID=3346867 RepID=UPI0036B8210A
MTAERTWKAGMRSRIGLAVFATAVVAFSTGCGASGEGKDQGPIEFTAEPCWGLLEESDVAPVLAKGQRVKVDSTDLEKSVKDRRTSFCNGNQQNAGGAGFNAYVQWRSENPYKNSDPVDAWEPLKDGTRPEGKDWGAGAETWSWGTRVAVECTAELPAGAPASYKARKFLDVRVSGKAAEGVGSSVSRQAFANMTLKLARGVAEKVGCTNDLHLPQA